jgi:kumamolisin
MPGGRIERIGGSRDAPEGAAAAGAVDRNERVTITVHVKRRSPDKFAPGSAGDLARLRVPITREALAVQRARTHGRAAARVTRFAKANGLVVRETDVTRRRVVLEGTAQQMTELFGIALAMYDDGRGPFRARTGPLFVPAEIAPWTRAVLGFDQRPLVVRRLQDLAGVGQGNGLLPTEIAALYGLRLDRDVSTQCVGIIALGGGYLQTDLDAAAVAVQRPPAHVVDQSVGGASNAFGGGTLADQEIALDLQVLAGLIPKARIVVYFAQNNIRVLADALHQAVWDDVNRPQVLSVSWGSAEKFWTVDARDAVQAALADAVRLNVSVVFAAGDELATAGLTDGKAHVSFPASSPYVLSCGGTTPMLDAGGAIATEAVWNEGFQGTGGGISDVFPVPDYQSGLALPASVNDKALRRGVPDVAGAAAKTPGYRIFVNGAPATKDGTSAVTPLWAALIAHANAQRGAPIGLVNPALYADAALLRQITQGDNRVDHAGKGYDAGAPWNACTGLGVPNGEAIIAALAADAVA